MKNRFFTLILGIFLSTLWTHYASAALMLEEGEYENTSQPDNCHKISVEGSYSAWTAVIGYGYSCGDYRFSMNLKCNNSYCKAVSYNGTPVTSGLEFDIAANGTSFRYRGGSRFVKTDLTDLDESAATTSNQVTCMCRYTGNGRQYRHAGTAGNRSDAARIACTLAQSACLQESNRCIQTAVLCQ